MSIKLPSFPQKGLKSNVVNQFLYANKSLLKNSALLFSMGIVVGNIGETITFEYGHRDRMVLSFCMSVLKCL